MATGYSRTTVLFWTSSGRHTKCPRCHQIHLHPLPTIIDPAMQTSVRCQKWQYFTPCQYFASFPNTPWRIVNTSRGLVLTSCSIEKEDLRAIMQPFLDSVAAELAGAAHEPDIAPTNNYSIGSPAMPFVRLQLETSAETQPRGTGTTVSGPRSSAVYELESSQPQQTFGAMDHEGKKNTALHSNASNGHKDIVEYILGQGVPIDIANEQGLTALHLAALKGHSETVSYLLSQKASTTNVDKEGRTALHFAAIGGEMRTMYLLLQKYPYIDKQDSSGRTALHLASSSDQGEVASLLVKQGAAIDKTDKQGQTPLHLASIAGYLGVVDRLLEGGAPVSLKDHQDHTALHLAALKNRSGIVPLLMGRKADVNEKNDRGQTALHISVTLA